MLRREDGFTLIELLIVVTTIGMITGAISMVIINSLRITDETQSRLEETADSQLMSAYFVTDVHNADIFGGVCGAPPGATSLITFQWTNPGEAVAADDDAASVVSYFVEPGSDASSVTRYSCIGSGAAERTVLMDDVVGASMTCIKAGGVEEAAPTGCLDPLAPPVALLFDAEVCERPSGGTCTIPSFSFELRAQRRTSA